jgi:indole-3-glycerol phosphate synthase
LTDEKYFGGCDAFITTARQSGVTIPVLYKNFVINEIQLYAAVLCGASAVLLIAACLTKQECRYLMNKAHELGLEVLLEMHSEQELEYAELEPDLCGINNRNLGSFVTDVETSFRLAELLPKDAVKVSESGISDPKTVVALREAGFRGFLIGENFMKTSNPGQALKEFLNSLKIEH